MAVVRFLFIRLWMWRNIFAGISFWCFAVGSRFLYPLCCLCKINDVWLEEFKVGSLQRCVQKDVDTSDISDLTVPWMSFFFLVMPNWFCCTEAANYETRIVLCSCGIPSRNLSVIPECLRNENHLYQFPDRLVLVALVMLFEALRLPLAMISRRKLSWADVLCRTMLLFVVLEFGWNVLLVSGLTYGNLVRGNPRWCFLFP